MGQYVELDRRLGKKTERAHAIKEELSWEFENLLRKGGVITARGLIIASSLAVEDLKDLSEGLKEKLERQKVIRTRMSELKPSLNHFMNMPGASSHIAYLFEPGSIEHLAYFQRRLGSISGVFVGTDGNLSNGLEADRNFTSSFAERAHHILRYEGIPGSHHRFTDEIIRDLAIKYGLGELKSPRVQTIIRERSTQFSKTA